ncbi:MAG: hypothetical protein AB1782_19955 [Cyanobacteriota bacterium]
MVNINVPITFTAIEAKGYRTPNDKKPVKISIPDKQGATITGEIGEMFIKEGKKEVFGPFARITVDKLDNDSYLKLTDTADVIVNKIDTGGHLNLENKSVAKVGTIKKGLIWAFGEASLLIKALHDGADVSIAKKANVVIENFNLKGKDNSQIRAEAGSFLRIKKASNVALSNLSDGRFVINNVRT